jgi:7,8-dihydroneopterin aldolase/epimerase/oxygenase
MELSNFDKKTEMGLIEIENMEFYSYHGHYPEERIIGNRFIVDLQVLTSLGKASETDDLNDTINYQSAYEIVKEQMLIKSNLLEHVAKRILDSLYERFSSLESVTVKISKMNPPLGGQIGRVSVTLSR